MVADKDKIAALKAIRDKTLAEMAAAEAEEPISDQCLEEDDSFPPHEDFEEDKNAVRYRPEIDEDEIYESNFGDYPEQDFDTAEDDYGASEDDYDDDEEPSDYDENASEEDDEDADADADDAAFAPASSGGGNEWRAVFKPKDLYFENEDDLPLLNIEFNGKNLENGEFDHENLQDANFSAANLSGVNFSGSDLRGADFSGANLTNTDLSGADLSGATFAGAQLIGTNFTGATLKNAVFTDAFFQDAILLDLDIDDITIEELQQLIEFVAQYYPEKLDLTRINLTLFDLKRIDLSKVNLRGVDFTGVDFTGVNIFELDLSECIITPEQIAQALGRVPSAEELKRILAPKNKKKGKGFSLDFTELFLNGHKQFGVIDLMKYPGMDTEKLVKIGQQMKKVWAGKEKAPVEDKEALEYARKQNRANKEELRQVIEERKRRELANRSRRKQQINHERGGYQR